MGAVVGGPLGAAAGATMGAAVGSGLGGTMISEQTPAGAHAAGWRRGWRRGRAALPRSAERAAAQLRQPGRWRAPASAAAPAAAAGDVEVVLGDDREAVAAYLQERAQQERRWEEQHPPGHAAAERGHGALQPQPQQAEGAAGGARPARNVGPGPLAE